MLFFCLCMLEVNSEKMEVGREWIVAIYLENVKSSSERDREHVTTAVSKIRTGYIYHTHTS